MAEAQAKFPAMVEDAADHPVRITRRNETVGYIISPDRMDAMLETMEILANPAAMEAIRKFEAGKETYVPLADLLDEE